MLHVDMSLIEKEIEKEMTATSMGLPQLHQEVKCDEY